MIIRNKKEIIVNIPNKIIGMTVIKRQAKFLDFDFSHGEGKIGLNVMETPFAQGENDRYGESLASDPLFKAQLVQIIAKDDIVDQQGNLVYVTEENGTKRRMTPQEAEAAPEAYFYEFEWYNMVAEKQAINVFDFIKSAIDKHYLNA